MKISVIIPTFNRAEILERSLKSVLQQSYQDFEVLIVDDGSTDKTYSTVKKYFSDKRVKYIYQSNKGVSAARNLGVSLSSYDWISFLDSDDEWLSNKLDKQVALLQENSSLEFIHSEENWIRNGKKVNQPKHYKKFGGNIFLKCLSLCAISPSTVLMTKRLFKEVGGFSSDYIVCEDFDLWLKITSKYEVGLVDEFLINKYGGHEDQLSTKFFAMDLFRVRSLVHILEIRDFTERIKEEIISVILSKSKILLKGYEKHENFKDYEEVKSLVLRFNS
ncbi:glycosyltransferase [Halobacteriovorax sp. JY17]|uniref:glycosyltransferase family 2 protein n=1 Tax=Halobacteriovorax sp. JY17 TaxID=2014617 RepID=UPI000C568152|nr:glycosyltransferase [Halobacteriovorax sp. JY17]PIK13751.1 MAG: glycosyl transferase [Halobacteriovorax sp. JY17]